MNLLDNAVARGAGKRVLGVAEFELNAAKALAKVLGMNTKEIDELKKIIAMGQQQAEEESKGRTWAGFAGEMAGDPISWMGGSGAESVISKAAPKVQKAIGMILTGAAMGGGAGLTQGSGKAESDISGNIKNAGIGAGIGAAAGGIIPAIPGTVKAAAGTAKGVGQRIAASMGSEKAAENVARNILANQLKRSGYTAEEVAAKLKNPGVLKATLGEITQSPDILQTEKSLAKGTGESAKIMRDALYDRNVNYIPQQITQMSKDLTKKAGDTAALYKAAASEADLGKKLLDKIAENPAASNADSVNQYGFELLKENFGNVQKAIANRLDELGDAPTLERTALNKANEIMKNAFKRGKTFEAVLDAKKQLGDLYIENADTNAQKAAQRFVSGYTKELDSALQAIAPENYPAAKESAMLNMASRDLSGALDESRVGGIRQLWNKLWATPELRDDFLRKLPEADRPKYEAMFNDLENVSRGMAGSDTAFNAPAGQKLSNDVLGYNPDISNPFTSPQAISKWIGDKFYPAVSKGLAKETLSPSQSIADQMAKNSRSVLDNSVVKNSVTPAAVSLENSLMPSAIEQAPAMPQSQDDEILKQIDARISELSNKSIPASNPAKDEDILKQIDERINQLSSEKHSSLPDNTMDQIAMVESGGNPNAKNPNSTASGTYQFTDPTWKSMVDKYGAQNGIGIGDKNKPEAQRVMARLLADENGSFLKKKGFEATPENIYLAHFLGAPGAGKVLSNPNAFASDILPTAAKANRNIFFKGSNPVTGSQLQQILASKLRRNYA